MWRVLAGSGIWGFGGGYLLEEKYLVESQRRDE